MPCAGSAYSFTGMYEVGQFGAGTTIALFDLPRVLRAARTAAGRI
jgi:hypothetical protein